MACDMLRTFTSTQSPMHSHIVAGGCCIVGVVSLPATLIYLICFTACLRKASTHEYLDEEPDDTPNVANNM